MIPTYAQAQVILVKYNKEPFHIMHGQIVSETMRYFVKEYDVDNEDYWSVVGLLHDIDFELYSEEHCVKGVELLRNENVDDNIIHSAMSHGWGLTETVSEPAHIMEKILFAVDELTGLIGAAALMRPSKSVADMELSSLKKKVQGQEIRGRLFPGNYRKGCGNVRLDAGRIADPYS
jgi:predicted hydrolase (HD superfamily)